MRYCDSVTLCHCCKSRKNVLQTRHKQKREGQRNSHKHCTRKGTTRSIDLRFFRGGKFSEGIFPRLKLEIAGFGEIHQLEVNLGVRIQHQALQHLTSISISMNNLLYEEMRITRTHPTRKISPPRRCSEFKDPTLRSFVQHRVCDGKHKWMRKRPVVVLPH